MRGACLCSRDYVGCWSFSSLGAAWRHFRFREKRTLAGHRKLVVRDPCATLAVRLRCDAANAACRYPHLLPDHVIANFRPTFVPDGPGSVLIEPVSVHGINSTSAHVIAAHKKAPATGAFLPDDNLNLTTPTFLSFHRLHTSAGLATWPSLIIEILRAWPSYWHLS
jgi:hypothetical protein